ncbi:hypothetical protein SteCoe_37118 [Stentor coeruleus]|uniref:Metalloenzyme domain-containing protein n=1 Tax=Stentor coeruleus TaxID=5963 RepID=A0A1R2ANR2_9CILI|nr:hypothetical protein SteCoe_37118 [Stentor coeruleus]
MIDGIGDSQNVALGGKTYIEEAKTPSLDRILAAGLSGVMDPVETGLACGSDTAHMSIFGYNPLKFYQGRGSFETMGAGLELGYDEIAFKCNFATFDSTTGIVTKRRVSRNFYMWGLPIIDAINNLPVTGFENYIISVKHATEHRCGLKITGPNLSHKIEGTDPLKDNLPLFVAKAWDENDADAVKTANIVNAVSKMLYEILSAHPINHERIAQKKSPANILLLRGAGVRLNVQKFDEKYGIKSFFIAPTAIIRGWGITLSSEIIEIPGTTGDVHSNHQAKFDKALELLKKEYNFGFLHIKAIDDLGHDRNIPDRVNLLEKIDGMIGTAVDALDNCVIVVTGDHSTNAYIGDHSFEPVPFVMAYAPSCSGLVPKVKYSEVECAKGVLGRFPGHQVMPTIFKYCSWIDY